MSIRTLKTLLREEPDFGRPRIVTLCGSTRFKEQFIKEQMRLTLAGVIVLTVGFFHVDTIPITADQKQALDQLHFQKIRISDGIFVINPEGYIGESTKNEIGCAIGLSKNVNFLDGAAGESYLSQNSHELGRIAADFATGKR